MFVRWLRIRNLEHFRNCKLLQLWHSEFLASKSQHALKFWLNAVVGADHTKQNESLTWQFLPTSTIWCLELDESSTFISSSTFLKSEAEIQIFVYYFTFRIFRKIGTFANFHISSRNLDSLLSQNPKWRIRLVPMVLHALEQLAVSHPKARPGINACCGVPDTKVAK